MKRGRIERYALLAAALMGCSDWEETATKETEKRAPHVLVHGAWMGAWAWSDVARELEAEGVSVTSVELPGHGADTTPPTNVTLDAYVIAVRDAVEAQPEPVVLVGHSLAGVVITEVAEQTPARIAKVVYVAAYVPKDGDTLQSLAMMDAGSHVGPMLMIDPAAATAALPESALADIFCADCRPAQLEMLAANYRDEPVYPFTSEAHPTDANWGSVSKHYVFTTQDHAVSHGFQRTMTEGVGFVSTATLDSSHSPMLSQPTLMAHTLLGF